MRFASPGVADLALLGVVVIWGFTFPLVKGGTETAPIFGFLTLRFLCALVAFLPFVLRRQTSRVPWSRHLGPGLVAGLALGSCLALQTYGLRATSATMGGFLTGTSVVMVPIGAALWLRARLRRSEALGVALVAFGLPFLSGVGSEALVFGRGEVLVLGCALAGTVHMLVVGRYAPTLDGVRFTAVQLAVVLVAAALCAGAVDLPQVHLLWNRKTLVAVAFTGLLATTVAFWVQTEAQRFTSAMHVALIFSLEPIFAALASWWLEGETLTPVQLGGAGLMFVGSLVAAVGPFFGARDPEVRVVP